ncbi:thermonuclease family protein [Devosia sp. ZB163]|uniref:thermonuclease family protein n=1 Tax=Devosia sp. ZB163 TaxID=3025938 RepID=UPI00235F000A|nr:thermonuclease family protein [Devosia sp. ZB163]MDC9822295.1 thermonuclease family protein [Devosia sp. ZB163]
MNRTIAIAAAALSLALAGSAVAKEVVSGAAKVVDADIIMVEKQRVILWAVDAPERTQECYIGELKWDCYGAARQALGELIASGEASCTLEEGKPDQFNRRHGVCTSAGKDIGAELVRLGVARAYVEQGEDYLTEEGEAKAAQIGVFQPGAKIDDPWAWRKRDPRNYR